MRNSPHECLTEAEIEAYVLKRTPPETLDFIEDHLLFCVSCIEKVEAEENFVRDFRSVAGLFQKCAKATELKKTGASEGSSSLSWLAAFWLRPQGWILAAAVIAVVMLIFAFGKQRQTQAQQAVYLDIALRDGSAVSTASRANASVRLSIDLAGVAQLPEYSVEIVDQSGEDIARAVLKPRNGRIVWNTGIALRSGTYWIRLIDPRHTTETLREYQIKFAD